ncbi:MAG: AzlC family ABC transporter permease [Legionellaceae bacterium]|nr:AzlC family ABC transporter permease [Legionellaceae bacterium]
MKTKIEFKHALKLSTPTLFAYVPLGIVFTMLWLKAGFPAFWAPVMSTIAFAGAVQFVALSMMQVHADVLAIIIAISFIAFRNVFYGLSLIDRFKDKPLHIKLFLIFGLVDPTYGILVTHPENPKYNDTSFCFYVTLLPYIYWVSGSFMGLFLYSSMPDIAGLDFMLTSFFMILVVDYYLISRDNLSLLVPIVLAFISYILLPNQYLVVSILLSMFFINLQENRKEKESQEL